MSTVTIRRGNASWEILLAFGALVKAEWCPLPLTLAMPEAEAITFVRTLRAFRGTHVTIAEEVMARRHTRTTRDVWHFYVNYGFGWQHETTEITQAEMRVNRKAYRENCPWPLRIVKGREEIEVR